MSDNLENIIESIAENTNKKKVLSLCKKIRKKCSFQSVNDLDNLVNLAAWLFVYDNYDESIKVCDLIKDTYFSGNYTLWNKVDDLWCIKARILRENAEKEEVEKIIVFINQYRSPQLYKNIIPWFTETLDSDINYAMEVLHSKSTEYSTRLLKMINAIWFREAGNCPIDNGTLDKIISEQKEILSKVK